MIPAAELELIDDYEASFDDARDPYLAPEDDDDGR